MKMKRTLEHDGLLEVLPDPVSLIESMRAVGYTIEAAIADLIDNSISAGSRLIRVEYDASDQDAYVAILDDGCGMSPSEVTEAMRHGRNPSDVRDPKDLGRFGLGLKTASLSQCRKLTVLSKKDGVLSARRWDLDVVQQEEKWVVVVPTAADYESLPLATNLKATTKGTLVIWQNLDRLIAGAVDPQLEMTLRFESLRNHLALVFHRFTTKEEDENPIEIYLNGLQLPTRDPFLKANHYRQPLEGQVINHPSGQVKITPYILPPISHLSAEEIELAGGKHGLRNSQGFYVYRGRRLVIWGTWFRLVPKDEFFKLSRIQVDIPNSFDELWALDIKKSAAYPPDIIRTRLKELIPYFAVTSKKTITYPGRKSTASAVMPIWNRIEPSHGTYRYSIDPEHPLIRLFHDTLDQKQKKALETLISIIEAALPTEAIYADMCEDKKRTESITLDELIRIASALRRVTKLPVAELFKIDPIGRYPSFHADLEKEIRDD
jgi:hypothetical protein